jgi:hypothetical protein
MILTGKTKQLEEKLVPLPLCPPQIPRADLGANPGLRGVRPATNRLSHATARPLFLNFVYRQLGCSKLDGGQNPEPNDRLVNFSTPISYSYPFKIEP